MKHDIPAHLIPSEDVIFSASEEERELNEQLDTDRWVYTEEPDDGLCPYCGKEYKRASFASQHLSKGVCPYPVEELGDFILQFVHKEGGFRSGRTYFCSPEYEETLVKTGTLYDRTWDLTNI